MTTLIHANDVTVIRQGKHILKNISVEINEKDFITIIGPNGAGKSMLLRCLMGSYPADTGHVIRKKHLRIGYVPQSFAPNHSIPITTERFLRLRKVADDQSIQRIAREIHIQHILNKSLDTLSGGELQRALLARCLLDNPELLILDEPAQNLDISGQLAFYKLLETIYAERPLSILMVSHDLHMVMASSKKVICLFHHICCSGKPHVVTKDPEFISLFGNDMANMMAYYQHNHNHHHIEE